MITRDHLESSRKMLDSCKRCGQCTDWHEPYCSECKEYRQEVDKLVEDRQEKLEELAEEANREGWVEKNGEFLCPDHEVRGYYISPDWGEYIVNDLNIGTAYMECSLCSNTLETELKTLEGA